jgi:DNA-binding helix-hairpin-helix protein with protein kinase domain
VPFDSIRLGNKLGEGGQGSVHAVMGTADEAVKIFLRPDSNREALESLVSLRLRLSTEEQAVLDTSTTWPHATVTRGDSVVGILMRRVPETFLVDVGGTPRPRDASFAVFPPKPSWPAITQPSPEQRWELARQATAVFAVFHTVGAIYGDVSYHNIAWSLEPSPRVFIMDCDAVRVAGQHATHRHAATIDWNDPAHPDGATLDSDRYKLSLLIGRLLLGSPYWRPETAIADGSLANGVTGSSQLDRLMRRAGGRAGSRPTAREWVAALTP